MRVLILTGSPAYARDSLQLFAEQIVAGPDWPDAQTLDGHWLSLRTPAGVYDLAELLAKIPAYQRPDVVVCLVDAAWRNQPRNLRSFAGTKVLVLSDRAGEEPAMADLFRYVGAESFDRVMFLKEQAHLVRLLTGAASDLPAGLREATWSSAPIPSAEARAV